MSEDKQKGLRFDIYYGYRGETGPLDCSKIFYDPQVHELEDLFNAFIEMVDEAVTQLSGDDEESEEDDELSTDLA